MADNPIELVAEIALREIVDLLNDGFNKERPHHAAAHANFVQLVQAWQKTQLLSAPFPTLIKMKFPPGCPTWREIEKRCQAWLPPAGTGAKPTCIYVGQRPWTAWDEALEVFIRLVTNPARHKFGGPCDRCHRYYIKKRASQKVYCSRSCGNAATAAVRTRQKWDEQHTEKLKLAAKAANQWARLKTGQSWKDYVCAKYPEMEISPKFLTRAVNKGELSEPIKERN